MSLLFRSIQFNINSSVGIPLAENTNHIDEKVEIIKKENL